MRGVKRYLASLLLFLFVFTLSGIPVAKADLEDIKAEAYVLMDADSGKVLVAKNEHQRLPPASMTKLMTLVLAAEALQEGKVDLKDKVVTSENAWKMGGSQIYLEPGEEMTYEDMMIAIAVGSANDACVAVAEHLDGSHQNFVDKMNRYAKEWGLKDTHFINTYGLPADGHYTSAYDMAVIARHALKYPRVKEYCSIKEYDLRQGEFKLYNTNKLLWWYQGTDGFKTGWTTEAKYCLTSTAKRNDLRLISVVMASPEVRGHFRDSMQLLNYGFGRYSYKNFFPANSVCGIVKVGKGSQEEVEVIAAEDAGCIHLKDEKDRVSANKTITSYVDAPVKKGQRLGEIQVLLDGKVQKKVALLASQDVPRGGLWKEIIKMFAEIFLL